MPKTVDIPGTGVVEFPDSMSDDQISSAIRSQHQSTAPSPPTNASIGPAYGSGIGQTLRGFEEDFRQGTGNTMAGRVLQALGAKGVNVGSNSEAGNYIGSPVLGLTEAAQGVAEKSPLRVLKGAADAATIPSTFMGLGAVEAATPSAVVARAGAKFGEFEKAVGSMPINVSKAGEFALKAKELADAGATLPKVLSKFLNRATSPDAVPMTISEARKFASNASRLSAQEYTRMTDQMRSIVAQFTGEMHGSIAEASGQASNYYKILKGYGQANDYADVVGGMKALLLKNAKAASVGATGGAGAALGYKWMHK